MGWGQSPFNAQEVSALRAELEIAHCPKMPPVRSANTAKRRADHPVAWVPTPIRQRASASDRLDTARPLGDGKGANVACGPRAKASAASGLERARPLRHLWRP